jgi:hypothetical protein
LSAGNVCFWGIKAASVSCLFSSSSPPNHPQTAEPFVCSAVSTLSTLTSISVREPVVFKPQIFFTSETTFASNTTIVFFSRATTTHITQ